MYTITHTFISPKQFETTFSVSFKIDNRFWQVDLFQLVPKRLTCLLESSKYYFCNLFSHYLKFQDFQALLTTFQDFQDLDFFSNLRTFQDFQDQCEPWVVFWLCTQNCMYIKKSPNKQLIPTIQTSK